MEPALAQLEHAKAQLEHAIQSVRSGDGDPTVSQTLRGVVTNISAVVPAFSAREDTRRMLEGREAVRDRLPEIRLHASRTVPDLTQLLEIDHDYDPIVGGFGEVYRGVFTALDGTKNQVGVKVALKNFRLFNLEAASPQLHDFQRELAVMHEVSHPNILPCLGLALYQEKRSKPICLVLPWMQNGHVNDYLKANPSITARRHLFRGVVKGVAYLHGMSPPIMHGDLKAANVLVSDDGEALLADFGLARFVDYDLVSKTPSSLPGGTVWLLSPERIKSNDFPGMTWKEIFAPPADIFSLGMLAYEIFVGVRPFYGVKGGPIGVMQAIVSKERPTLPNDWDHSNPFLSEIEKIMNDCWKHEPASRPTITDIQIRLDELDRRFPAE